MPIAAPRPCTAPGCGKLATQGGRCDAHPRPAWVKHPKATKRITGRRLQQMREELLRLDPLCAECRRHGRITLAAQRDHIVPLAEGGADDCNNTQGLCIDCHDAKSKAEARRGRHGPAAGRAGGRSNL